jgi:hypothetical protein
VYHYKRALINLPQEYYTRKAVMEKPRIRNPLYLLGIDKSLWFTVYFLDERRIFKRTNIDALLDEKLTLLSLLKEEKIKSQDRKIDECELREKHKRDLKEVEKKKKERGNARNKIPPKRMVQEDDEDELLSDLSSGLHTEQFKAETLKSKLTSSLQSGINNKPHLKNNLKSSLHSKA